MGQVRPLRPRTQDIPDTQVEVAMSCAKLLTVIAHSVGSDRCTIEVSEDSGMEVGTWRVVVKRMK